VQSSFLDSTLDPLRQRVRLERDSRSRRVHQAQGRNL